MFEHLKQHPFILIGGVVGVLLVMQIYGKSSPASNPVQASSIDPNVLAYNTNQTNASTAQAIAAINAGSAVTIAENTNATQLAETNLKANVAGATVDASIFNTFANAINTNYVSQLDANGAALNIGSSPASTISGGAGLNRDPAGSATINTANTQLEEVFNNIIRAGQGISPWQNQLTTNVPVTTPSTVIPVISSTPLPSYNFGDNGNHSFTALQQQNDGAGQSNGPFAGENWG